VAQDLTRSANQDFLSNIPFDPGGIPGKPPYRRSHDTAHQRRSTERSLWKGYPCTQARWQVGKERSAPAGQIPNNRLEADHGALKRLINPTRGFKTLPTASATIKGFEAMRMIRKRNCLMLESVTAGKVCFVNRLFRLAA
jgi:hypothetical protein